MIPLLQFILVLLASTGTGLLLMFVPALMELKKPLDAGPRLIQDTYIPPVLSNLRSLLNLEDESLADVRSTKIAQVLDFLPNLKLNYFLNSSLAFFHWSLAKDTYPPGLP